MYVLSGLGYGAGGYRNGTDLEKFWSDLVQKGEIQNPKLINVQNLLYVYPLFCPRSYEPRAYMGGEVRKGGRFLGW